MLVVVVVMAAVAIAVVVMVVSLFVGGAHQVIVFASASFQAYDGLPRGKNSLFGSKNKSVLVTLAMSCDRRVNM